MFLTLELLENLLGYNLTDFVEQKTGYRLYSEPSSEVLKLMFRADPEKLTIDVLAFMYNKALNEKIKKELSQDEAPLDFELFEVTPA